MAKLKLENMKNMTAEELEQTINSLKEELYKLRVEAKSGRIEKPHRLRESRRNIARCLTIIRERKSA